MCALFGINFDQDFLQDFFQDSATEDKLHYTVSLKGNEGLKFSIEEVCNMKIKSD